MTNTNSPVALTETPATPNPLGLNDTAIAKMTEYGGFIASVLALSYFFRVLTQFVKEVKEN